MKKRLAGALCAGILSLGMFSTANAALHSRLGGQAYYDDTLDITWLADAYYAQTSGYNDDDETWDQSQTWIGTLNAASHLGVNNWRLPMMVDTGAPGCDNAFSGTDCGYNVQTGSAATTVFSEMASLFYDTLGNMGLYDTSGSRPQPGWGLLNTGPFDNLQFDGFWLGTEYAPDTEHAWAFVTGLGVQGYSHKGMTHIAWAVRSGDVSAVPVPAAVWLFGTGLIGLFGIMRKKQAQIA